MLIVDDHEGVRAVLALILRDCGLDVHEAADGVEGLDCYLNGQFDLVITDLDMPRMNGLELAAAIKIHKPGQKVFLFTAHAAELAKTHLPCVDRLLPKPISMGELRDALVAADLPIAKIAASYVSSPGTGF